MVKYCPKCGTELYDSDSFCNECGYSVDNKEVTKSSGTSGIMEKIRNNPKNQILLVILIIAILIIIAVAVSSVYSGYSVYISDVEFHIPEGYEYDSYHTQLLSDDPDIEVGIYSGELGDIKIFVSDATPDLSNNKTIHGKTGEFTNSPEGEFFEYTDNGKFIGIVAPTESMIDKIIV